MSCARYDQIFADLAKSCFFFFVEPLVLCLGSKLEMQIDKSEMEKIPHTEIFERSNFDGILFVIYS